ncbi:MAG: hypothetical protein WC737_03115 [Parcubacteria group bacterium]
MLFDNLFLRLYKIVSIVFIKFILQLTRKREKVDVKSTEDVNDFGLLDFFCHVSRCRRQAGKQAGSSAKSSSCASTTSAKTADGTKATSAKTADGTKATNGAKASAPAASSDAAATSTGFRATEILRQSGICWQ